jgi:hypothetical protein
MRWLIALAALAVTQDPLPERYGYTVQSEGSNRYEGMYGKPEFYSLEILVSPLSVGTASDIPEQKSIRTVGRLWVVSRPGAEPPLCSLCTEDGKGCLSLMSPAEEIRGSFFNTAPFRQGDEAEVVGAFAPVPPTAGQMPPGVPGPTPPSTTYAPITAAPIALAAAMQGGFFFWSFSSAPPRGKAAGSGTVPLESLVRRPDRYQGKTIVVSGRFRGANLFGDMPADSPTGPGDWVLRDGPFFIWVTGRSPKGQGFALRLDRPSDGAYRLAVEGRPEVRNGLVYLRARGVTLLGRGDPANESAETSR